MLFLTLLIGAKLILILLSAMLFTTSSTSFCSLFNLFLASSRSSFDNFSVSKYLESISINSLFYSFRRFSLELASIIMPFSLDISSSKVLRDSFIDFISS